MVRTVALEGDERTTWVSVYAPCNKSDTAPLFYEALAALERHLLVSSQHQFIMAGDFNATALDWQRRKYKTKSFESDALFRAFVSGSELRLITGNDSTWHSATHPCHAVLDHFLCKDAAGTRCRVEANDHPALDHRQVWLDLCKSAGCELPRYEAKSRVPQLNIALLEGRKADVRTATAAAFTDWTPSDDIGNDLRSFVATVNKAAEEVLGFRPAPSLIPHRNARQKALMDRMTLYKVGLREAHDIAARAAHDYPVVLPKALSRLYRRVRPRPESAVHDFSQNHALRIEAFAASLKTDTEELRDLIRLQKKSSLEAYVAKCRERMQQPDGGEIKRLLGKHRSTVNLVAIESACPDTLVVEGPPPSEQYHYNAATGESTITELGTEQLLEAITQLPEEATIRTERRGRRVVTATSDVLAAWEFDYAGSSATTRWTCEHCGGRCPLHLPLPATLAKPRRIVTLCTQCKGQANHKEPPLPKEVDGVVRKEIQEVLNAPFTLEDLNARLDSLSKGKATLPASVKNELLSHLPPSLRAQLLALLNRVVAGGPGNAWKTSLVKLLPKDGETVLTSGFRPITLLCSLQKVFTSLLEDRLRQAAEKYDLLGATQEGFRHRRSCARQTHTLKYLLREIERAGGTAFVAYLDFKSAFDSPDVATFINFLRLTGFEGCEILEHLYEDVTITIDTAVGPTAPITKTRGTAQGDGLSPILFDLVIAVLIRRLEACEMGVKVDNKRIGSLWFADDGALIATMRSQLVTGLSVVEQFEKDTGLRLNIPKCKLTAWNYGSKRDLSSDCVHLSLRGSPIPETSIIPGQVPFRYLGTETALAPKVRCHSQRHRIIAGASALAHILRGHVYTAQQGIAVARMALESTFSFSASTADWTGSSLDLLLLAWARAYKAAGKLSNGCAGCLLTWPAAMGAATFPSPQAVLLRSLMGEVSRLVAFDDHVRALAQLELHHLFSQAGTSNLGHVGQWVNLEPQEGPVASLLGLAARLGIEVTLPSALTPGPEAAGPDGVSWLGLFLSNAENRCNVKASFKLFRPLLQRCSRSNLRPGHMTVLQVKKELGACLVNINPDLDPPAVTLPDLLEATGPAQMPIVGFLQGGEGGGAVIPPPPPPPPTVLSVIRSLVFTNGPDQTPMPGQPFYGPDVHIQDFAARRDEIFDTIQSGLPEFVLNVKGAGPLQNRECTEADFIKACEKLLQAHNSKIARPAYINKLNAFFTEASLPRPAAVDGKSSYKCTVTSTRTVVEDGKDRKEYYVQWDGWGHIGAKWRRVAGLSRDPVMKVQYDRYMELSALPPTPAQRPARTKASEWGWQGFPNQSWDLGQLDPNLTTVASHPTSDVPTEVGLFRLVHCKGVTSVYSGDSLAIRGAGAKNGQPAQAPAPLFLINTARLGWLLDLLQYEVDPMDKIALLVATQSTRERAHPVLSQQGQEFLTRGTTISHAEGLCPLTVWAGLDTVAPEATLAGVLWFVCSPVGQTEIDAFTETNKDWLIVTHCRVPIRVNSGAHVLVEASNLHILQAMGMWKSDKTLTKLNHHPISIWCSVSLEQNMRSKFGSMDSSLTKDGKVSIRNLDLWQRELRHSEAGCAYQQVGTDAGLGATDGSVRGGKAGSSAVWTLPGSPTVLSASTFPSGRQKVFRSETEAITVLLNSVPIYTEMWILVDCAAVLDGIKARCRTWKRFRQSAKIDAELAADLDRVLLRRQEAGTKTQFVKVRSHRADPFNEEADSVAEQATIPERDMDPNLYPHLVTVKAGEEHQLYRQVGNSVVQKCALLFAGAEQKRKLAALIRRTADGNQPDLPPRTTNGLNFTESFLQYEDVGREFLGRFLSGQRTEVQRNLLQSISGTFPTNHFLHHRLGKLTSGNCECGQLETMTHIQCVCLRLKESRIKVHHEIWRGICAAVEKASPAWQCFLEQTAGLCLPDSAPAGEELNEWNNMTKALTRSPARARGAAQAGPQPDISRQRPDGFLINWATRTAVVCEFSRRMDHTPHSCTQIDSSKHRRYTDLINNISSLLPTWKVHWAPFSVGVRGTILKTVWRKNFELLNVPADQQEGIMAGAVLTTLQGHGTLLASRRAANFAGAGPGTNPPPLPLPAPHNNLPRGRRSRQPENNAARGRTC